MTSVVTVTLNTAIDRLIEVEGFHVGGHLPGRLLARVPAGKGVNVSRALALLGVSNVATGFVGRGELEDYEQALTGTDALPQFLALEGATRENITLIDPKPGVETHVREVGPSPTPADLERLRNKLNLITNPRGLVVLSGSLPPGVTVDYVVGLVDMLLAKESRIAIDGPGQLLRHLGDRRLWLIKPNVAELLAMCQPGAGFEADQESPDLRTPASRAHKPSNAVGGPPLDVREEAASASSSAAHAHDLGVQASIGAADDEVVRIGQELSRHIRVVIVSRGAAGGYLFIDGSALIGQVDFDPGLARNSVGCGDCLLGAFIAAQLRGDDVKGSYEFALAAATAAAMEIVPGRFDPARVTELLGRTSVTPA